MGFLGIAENCHLGQANYGKTIGKPLSIISFKVYVVANISTSVFFIAKEYSIVWPSCILLIYSEADRCLGSCCLVGTDE